MIFPELSSSYDRRPPDADNIDFIRGCRPGCTLTASEVEDYLGKVYPVVAGSLRFAEPQPGVASFVVKLADGRHLRGRVEIRSVVEADTVTAYSVIDVL